MCQRGYAQTGVFLSPRHHFWRADVLLSSTVRSTVSSNQVGPYPIRVVAQAGIPFFMVRYFPESNTRIFFRLLLLKKRRNFFPVLNHTAPKMNIGHAGSAVSAVLAALKSPLQKKKSAIFSAAAGLGTTTLYP